jgi:predicted HicB family RNase H-like nuclease
MKGLLKYKSFVGSVNFSDEDKVLYGKIEGITDLISYEGDSVKDITNAFEEAVEDYLDLCAQVGKEPYKSFKGLFNVRIKPQLHKQATFLSIERGITLNKLVEEAIEKEVAAHSLKSDIAEEFKVAVAETKINL